jgi:hypothetical protein
MQETPYSPRAGRFVCLSGGRVDQRARATVLARVDTIRRFAAVDRALVQRPVVPAELCKATLNARARTFLSALLSPLRRTAAGGERAIDQVGLGRDRVGRPVIHRTLYVIRSHDA